MMNERTFDATEPHSPAPWKHALSHPFTTA